ncbi:hypothetical protein ACFFX0_09245 [Citricoccus parietis]|uniref:Secreted protein n=1 Tax=Citricoccus parietis TaxID=592307 RepID=A0ABV5FXH5_9MICC
MFRRRLAVLPDVVFLVPFPGIDLVLVPVILVEAGQPTPSPVVIRLLLALLRLDGRVKGRCRRGEDLGTV